MKQLFTINEWSIIEDGFHPEYNKITESVCSIANGRMGQRANFEEKYSGQTQPGNYVAGIYGLKANQEKTWLNSHPKALTKVVNAPTWIGIDVKIDGEELDLAICTIFDFRRELNMREGYLERTYRAQLPSGKEVEVSALRFTSIADDELGAIRFAIMPLNFSGHITLTPYVAADFTQADYYNQENYWKGIAREIEPGSGYLTVETKETGFQVCTSMRLQLEKDGTGVETTVELINQEKYIGNQLTAKVNEGEQLVLYKYAAVVSSENYSKEKLTIACELALDRAIQIGFAEMLDAQSAVWAEKWQESDLVIKGDAAAQQGIRFSIFQLHQTYTGEDERLNIPRKGFTGDKYNGATYWDTEVYCLPFFLASSQPHVARNLLFYRYQQLPQAIENAKKHGFPNGAALYPMATLNGAESHPDWEITAGEIHRNGAIAFAIYDYIRYTGDTHYLPHYGLEVLIGIARFWAQRINFSGKKQKYVMLGVNGPNTYEKNANNNWYTSILATWTLTYTLQALEQVKQMAPIRYEEFKVMLNLDEEKETFKWQEIIQNMYYPVDEELGIFLQQDDYLDKEQVLVADLDSSHRPINKKWTRDRVLRSCLIQKADVLQGLYLFEGSFDLDSIRRNYSFYEPRTVHESSLSPGLHAVIAAKIGDVEKAYALFLRSARLDLDDYYQETQDGCHITGMGGTWLAVVEGFGGMRIINEQLHFHPIMPPQWQSYTFKIRFRDHLLDITVTPKSIKILNQAEEPINFYLFNKSETISANNLANFTRVPEIA